MLHLWSPLPYTFKLRASALKISGLESALHVPASPILPIGQIYQPNVSARERVGTWTGTMGTWHQHWCHNMSYMETKNLSGLCINDPRKTLEPGMEKMMVQWCSCKGLHSCLHVWFAVWFAQYRLWFNCPFSWNCMRYLWKHTWDWYEYKWIT